MLGEAIPLLIKKLDRLQNHSAQMPNISENIMRIRHLIAQARKAASKVSVPVKFNGTSGVQVRNPGNLADLAAYTSLKFYITLPEQPDTRGDEETQQFVFYLGNKNSSKEFLGMVLQGKRLRWYFNVGGQTAEVLMQEDVKSDGNFNNIVLERILQYGQMSMSSETKELRVTKAVVEAGGDSGLLNLLTVDTVFYVGGFPSSFTPPPQLKLPNFKGCIELETLNEEVLSLYNFENIFHLNTTEEKPCGRRKAVLTQQWVNDAAYFDGTGYAVVTYREDSTNMQRFEQEVKLLSHNGILLMLHNENQFLCLAVQKGILKGFYDLEGTLKELVPKDANSPHLRISDGDSKALEIIVLRSSTTRVVVRNNRNTLYSHAFTEDLPSFADNYYLGGVPKDKMPETLQPLFPKQGSVKGCFRQLKAISSYIDLKKMVSSGVSYGCPDNLLVAREAHFSGLSYLDLGPSDITSLRDNFYAGFGFRSDQKNGLMLYHQAQDGLCQVFLDKGHVVVRMANQEIKSQRTYNDDNSHYVALYNNNTGMRVYVDDVEEKGEQTRAGGSSRATPLAGSVYLGGTPENKGVTNLTGCISNLFIKKGQSPQMVQNLLKAKENVDVPLACPAASKPQQILATPPRQKSQKKLRKPQSGGSRSRSTRQSCQGELSAQEPGAAHFSGSSHSFQRYDTLPVAFRRMPHISMAIRVNSSDGLLFHVPGQQGGAVMSLALSDGHLLLVIDGVKRKASIRTRKACNDGQWHTVFVKWEGERASLIVDGINAQFKRVSAVEKSHLGGPLYVGGAPPSLPLQGQGLASSFVGCVRDLTLNEQPAGSPVYSQGVAPCFQNILQPGAYFSSLGGHLAIDESLAVGRDLELQLEVRPVSVSGLLLHAGGKTGPHLSLFLNQGEVTVTVDAGSGQFSTSFTPEEPLCDGRWHTITVVKKSNVLQLHVDAASEHTVGPKQGRSSGGKETVYLGGVPDGVVVPGLPAALSSYHGCVRRAVLNNRPAMLSKPLSVHGAVATQGCPAM